jgi:hypothetical protein
MSTAPMPTNIGNAASSAHDLFALTDEQILEIEPEAHDIEILGGERSDSMDPLREDLDLLGRAENVAASHGRTSAGKREIAETAEQGRNAVAANSAPSAQNAPANPLAASDEAANAAVAPTWLAERMNDPQHGADARALWDGVQSVRREASAFREVFAKPEDARAAAERARTLDEIDRAYFGAAGSAPEQTSASRAQLAARMLRDDPAAFREMVFAGLRALEETGKQGTAGTDNTIASNAGVTARPPSAAAQNQALPTSQQTLPATLQVTQQDTQQVTQPSHGVQPQHHHAQSQQHNAQQHSDQQEARLVAYASFEKAANEDLERTVGATISRTLQDALPNAGKTENSAALKERLSGAIRQDVEKALQGDRALGEQVARILSGQRLDNAARAQVVRLIGERAQQLVPGVTRRVLADWTQTTLAAHGAGAIPPRSAAVRLPLSESPEGPQAPKREQSYRTPQPRKIDYRRISDDDILNS